MKHNIISQIMKNEHDSIDRMLDDIEGHHHENDMIKRMFQRFKWNLEKHFFIEEKVIFSVYSSNISEETSSDIETLLKEHKDILWLLGKAESMIKRNMMPDLSELKNILKAHAKFEDEAFYPKLDEELSEDQKDIIIQRAKDVVIL